MAAGLEGDALSRLTSVAREHGLDLDGALAGDDATLRATEVAQPALVAVEIALLAHLPATLEVVGVAGHSVGEYAAAVAAGALRAEDAMALVVARGSAMAKMRSGAMSALLGLNEQVVAALCAEASARGAGVVVVANVNAPGQVVVSGDSGAVAIAEELARERGCRRSVRLNVSGAFHSPLMRAAAAEYAPTLRSAPIRDARTPVVCNVDGAAVTAAGEVRSRLEQQLVSPVRWTDCVEGLVRLGAEVLVEVGPGAVLTGLAKRIVPGVRAVAAGTPDAVRGLAGALVRS